MATHPLVVLVEPNPVLRRVIRGELKDQGCIVFEAADGDEALAFAALYPGQIDLAVTDLQKTENGNADFISALHLLPAGRHAQVSSLMKPFDRTDLLVAIRRALPNLFSTPAMQGHAESGDQTVSWGSRGDRGATMTVR